MGEQAAGSVTAFIEYFFLVIHVFHNKFLQTIGIIILTDKMSSCVTVCMKTCLNSYTAILSEMNIFSLFLILVGIIGVLVFICMFWYTFTLHDFGQNDWEEKTEKIDRTGVYEVDKVDKELSRQGKAKENNSNKEETSVNRREKRNN